MFLFLTRTLKTNGSIQKCRHKENMADISIVEENVGEFGEDDTSFQLVMPCRFGKTARIRSLLKQGANVEYRWVFTIRTCILHVKLRATIYQNLLIYCFCRENRISRVLRSPVRLLLLGYTSLFYAFQQKL